MSRETSLAGKCSQRRVGEVRGQIDEMAALLLTCRLWGQKRTEKDSTGAWRRFESARVHAHTNEEGDRGKGCNKEGGWGGHCK